jgi:hypothetical protein
MAAHIVLPWVHRIFSNLKVWALGVYHGLRRKHLQSYLDYAIEVSSSRSGILWGYLDRQAGRRLRT